MCGGMPGQADGGGSPQLKVQSMLIGVIARPRFHPGILHLDNHLIRHAARHRRWGGSSARSPPDIEIIPTIIGGDPLGGIISVADMNPLLKPSIVVGQDVPIIIPVHTPAIGKAVWIVRITGIAR